MTPISATPRRCQVLPVEEYAEHALMSIEQGQGARIHTIKKTEVIAIL
jgi:hypothetical protein